MNKYTYLLFLLLIGCKAVPKPKVLPTREYVPPSNVVYLPLFVEDRNLNTYHGMAWAGSGSQSIQGNYIYSDWFHEWSVCNSNRGSHFVQNFSCTFALSLDNCMDSTFNNYVMFLNEPDNPGQCHKSASDAVDFLEILQNRYPNAKFVGPSISHLDYETGFNWINSFYIELESRNGRCPEYGDIHTYIQYESPSFLIDSYFETLDKYDCAPVSTWVGEFGSDDYTQTQLMLDAFVSDDRVDRIAWFAPCYGESMLLSDCKYLTDSGNAWIDYWSIND